MMKIALLGDVHGNLPALEAVLAHSREQAVEALWNIGDFVGYGPFPDEVVQLLQSERITNILGNYDRKVLKIKSKLEQWKGKAAEKRLAFEWAYDHLSEQSRQYLHNIPEQRRLQVEGWSILLTHASPASRKEHLSLLTPKSRLRELAILAGAQIIICGHSHQAFVRKVDQTWFINTGSVGRPDDGDPRACYAILELSPDQIEVQHYRLDYDIEQTVAEIRRQGLPEHFSQMFLQGRNLENITNN